MVGTKFSSVELSKTFTLEHVIIFQQFLKSPTFCLFFEGLTGRKIIVDTYGGWGAHGGGAFSGKDPSKVDRSAAYAARWIAKSLVASKKCHRCLVQLSYAIGVAKPLSVYVDTYGTNKVSMEEIYRLIDGNFDLRPGMIRKALNLRRPIYNKTAAYGHFGRADADFLWEKPKAL